ncbi:MAG: 50S ribosomal protein L9 [Sphingomonadales bacterium]|jgi:large subunit ribosomal protein L9
MQVILLERVEKLGQMGDEVTVKPGFARNFLLPRGKALRANDANRALFESRRAEIEAENLKRREEAEAVAKKIEGKKAVLLRQAGDTGQLYGSVSTRDVAEALEQDGVKILRSQVQLDRPIKALGLHEVRVSLHPEVIITISVNVARSAEEAELQESGVDMTLTVFEREELAAKAEAEAAEAAAAEEAEAAAAEEAAEAEVAEENSEEEASN